MVPPVFDLNDAGSAQLGDRSAPGESRVQRSSGGAGAEFRLAESAGFIVSWRLSTNAVIGDGDDIVLGLESGFPLSPPGQPTANWRAIGQSLTIPPGLTAGTRRLGYFIQSSDTNQANNAVLFTQTITIAGPAPGPADLVDAGADFWELSPRPTRSTEGRSAIRN